MWCDRYPNYRSTSQIGFKCSPIASDISQIHTWSRETITNVYSRSTFDEKNPKYESWGRKSIHRDANDFQPTAQQVKSGLNLLPLLLIDTKYIPELGKLSRTLFPAEYWAKNSEIWIWETKIDILCCDQLTTYGSTSHIGFKSSLIASNISKIDRSSRKTIETMFSRRILGENIPKCESWGRKSKYYDASDFQPTAQQVKLRLNLLWFLVIYQKYIDQVGKPPKRCFPAAFWVKKNPNADLGDENRHKRSEFKRVKRDTFLTSLWEIFRSCPRRNYYPIQPFLVSWKSAIFRRMSTSSAKQSGGKKIWKRWKIFWYGTIITTS